MSRFYDALKQASRSMPSGDGELPADAAEVAAFLVEASHGEPPAEPDESMAPAASPEENVRTTVAPPRAGPVSQNGSAQPAAMNLRAAGPAGESVRSAPSVDPASQNGALGMLTDAVLSDRAKVIPNSTEPMLVEFYRQVRTRIMQQQEKKPFRTLLVASADPKEGKTLTALNLAWTFGLLPSHRVLVIDADLRRGHLSHWLGIEDRRGLGDLLEGTATLKEVVLKSSAIPFCFTGLGQSKLSPAELVHSSRWPNRIREISEHFDLVIVDSPPVNLFADAQLLAAGCEAVLIVARAFYTSSRTLEKVCRDMQRFRRIGVVLNGGENMGSRHYKHYYGKS